MAASIGSTGISGQTNRSTRQTGRRTRPANGSTSPRSTRRRGLP